MGVCKDCLYYEEVEKEGLCVKLPEQPTNQKTLINKIILKNIHISDKKMVPVCSNPKRIKTDYISGESEEADAELFNKFGQCELFVDSESEPPLDIPEYPKLQLVAEKMEIAPEEEISIKCYADIRGDGKLSYKWYLAEVEVEDENDYEYVFSALEEGTFKIKCEVKNTDESCLDRQTSTSFMEIEIEVKEPEEEGGEEEENPSEENPSEPNPDEEEEITEPDTGDDSEYF